MLTDTYKPYISGITNYITLNKAALEKAGHEVYVFTFGDPGTKDDEVNIIRSPGLPIVDTGFYISFQYNRAARRLLYTMDVAHVHHPFLSGILARRYCRPRGIPILFTNHTRYDLYAHYYLPILPDPIGESMMQSYLPSFCRACDLVIAPSNGLRQILLGMGVDAEIEVVPNGVDLKPFTQIPQARDRATFGFTQDHVVLAYVGRLGPEKNLPFLLRAFAGAAHAYEHVRLLIIGDGSERDNLQDRVENMGVTSKVHFTGMVPYSDLPGYLAAVDAFVTASVTEVHPLSVIEAMASGLPVLGIQSPGVGDTVIDGVTGFLSSEDLAAFTAKMVRLVTEHELRRKMGMEACKQASIYAIGRTTQIMLEQYRKVIGRTLWRKRGLRARMARLIDRMRP
jgi:glycosyltransferase involved in cell wall biosynthesis